MNELDIYNQWRDMCIAHQSSTEWLQAHGFGVGYMDMLNANNLDQADYRKTYFYSEKWYLEGTNPNSMMLDWPFVLMLPVAGDGGVMKKQQHIEAETYKVVFYVLDLLYRDRNGLTDSPYAKRTREEIFASTHTIGQELLIEFSKPVTGSQRFQVLGDYHFEKLYDLANQRLAGTCFEFDVRLFGSCEAGQFDYGKEFIERKEKFCYC